MNKEQFINEITITYENNQSQDKPNRAISETSLDTKGNIDKCLDIAAGIVGIKDWRTLNTTS